MRLGRTLFAFIAGLLVAPASLAAPAETDKAEKQTVVIVHGAWGGSWAFRRIEQMLRAKGYDVYRPSLTGLGERVHLGTPDVGLSTHIDDVVNAIKFEDLHRVVLIGHSYGGMVISGVADRIPERLRKLVYLDAFVPNDGESVMGVLGPRSAWAESMIKKGFLVPPWLEGQSWPSDVPQPLKTFTEPLSLSNEAAKRIPAAYVLMVEKGKEAKSADFYMHFERAKARGWKVMQMQSDHNPQFSRPQALADLLGAQAKR
jgi:pimeloyl-ACP methyl ester carboxylesterase